METDLVVHVIDDDDAARDSLTFLLRTAKHKSVAYDSALTFLERLPNLETGCIITDVRMPDMDGIALLRKLKEIACPMPVIIITGHGDIPLAVEAMKIGAIDFIEKPYEDDILLGSVKRALEQRQKKTNQDTDIAEIEKRIASLTQREQQVMNGLIEGKANKVIAFDLSISPRTVEIYRANVMDKLGAKSLSELVRLAIRAHDSK